MGGEILSAILFIVLIVILFYQDRKAHSRENHEWWLSEVKECLHSIENEFRWKCQRAAEDHLSKHCFSKYKYDLRISELEKLYKKELTEKVIAQKRVRVTTLPDHLVKEYDRNISDIAYTFRYFGDLTSEQMSRKE